ncbi:MAG: 4Fe-4S dicluster domain-containing protein [Deltaproteobacteria bacterium]|nr:4Fe-4S dicluster domain-containing protein [Deltaproteobacteria bacterium]
MSKAVLIDTSKCIGCRACQVACKSWNDLPGKSTTFSDTWENPKFLDSHNYTRVLFREISQPGGDLKWQFIKRQCMHCLTPACASACPVGALIRLPEGPVVYNDDKCIGCRYCMMACPFQIPKFEWESAVPLIRKCTFCADRQAMGQEPACTSSCPTDALLFGERDKLLKEAHRRIGAHPGKYYPEVYGERTGGGASMLYLTTASFDNIGINHLGFRTDLGDYPHGLYGREWMSKVPWVALTVGSLAVGLHYLNKRRAQVQSQEHKEE